MNEVVKQHHDGGGVSGKKKKNTVQVMQIRGNQIDCGSVCKISEKGSYLCRSYHIKQCRRITINKKPKLKI